MIWYERPGNRAGERKIKKIPRYESILTEGK